MTKQLQTLLRLDGLMLTRKGLELTGHQTMPGGLEDLDHEIEKLRRRLLPKVASCYDRMSRKFADPVSQLTHGICQGCQQRNARRVALLTGRSHQVFQCEHCGRLLFAANHAPDYVS